jgi:uncharacterized protein YndB with AHSA1/START domain
MILSHTTPIAAPISRVWQTLADVGTIAEWHLGVKASPVLSDAATGMGARRRIELYDGGTSIETVTAFEEGRSLTVTMSEHTMPMSRCLATFSVEADGPDAARVTFTMDYDMKWGPAGWLIDTVMLRRVLRGLQASVLAGLDHHLRTGEHIGEGWEPAAAA